MMYLCYQWLSGNDTCSGVHSQISRRVLIFLSRYPHQAASDVPQLCKLDMSQPGWQLCVVAHTSSTWQWFTWQRIEIFMQEDYDVFCLDVLSVERHDKQHNNHMHHPGIFLTFLKLLTFASCNSPCLLTGVPSLVYCCDSLHMGVETDMVWVTHYLVTLCDFQKTL